MTRLLTLLLVGFASALVPLINIEAYLGVSASVQSTGNLWVLSLVAALGQMLGKVLWYLLGARSLGWRWIRRQIEKPKYRERLATWQQRTAARPAYAGALVFVSAATGFPPFAVLAVLAGQLRMRLWLFVVLGLAGRWLRFAAVLAGASWLGHLLFP